MIGSTIGGGETRRQCSAAGCSADAVARINWRNPRIHADDRVKVWLACADHRGSLADYLSTRGFPVLVSGIDETVDRVPAPA